MILLTAFDPDYILGNSYEASLHEHCNIPFRVFSVGSEVAGRTMVPKPDMPHLMLQDGGFIRFIPDIPDDEVIIFTDADLRMQRPFTPEEIAFLAGFKPGEVGCGINQIYGATLDLEFNQLHAVQSKGELEQSMPGFRSQRIWNTGFVVAQKATYQKLHEEFVKLRPAVDACFLWHPRVQFALSYLIGTRFQHVLIPQTLHTHGHCGYPQGVSEENGVLKCGGETVVFRHKI